MLYNCNISLNVWLVTYLKYILLIKWFSVYLRICSSWNEVLIGRIRELNLSIRYMLVCIWYLFTSRINFLLIMLFVLNKTFSLEFWARLLTKLLCSPGLVKDNMWKQCIQPQCWDFQRKCLPSSFWPSSMVHVLEEFLRLRSKNLPSEYGRTTWVTVLCLNRS